jgi:hypothetical protein
MEVCRPPQEHDDHIFLAQILGHKLLGDLMLRFQSGSVGRISMSWETEIAAQTMQKRWKNDAITMKKP